MQQHVEAIFVQELTAMGFSEAAATRACLSTHSCGVEPALDWLMAHAEDADLDEMPNSQEVVGVAEDGTGGAAVLGVPSDASLVQHPDNSHAPATVIAVHDECKVVILVSQHLGMSAGKIGAQCAHAAVGLYKSLVDARAPWLRHWEGEGEKTVVLAVEGPAVMRALLQGAEAAGLHTHQVHDAGRTEVAAGSMTVAAIGGRSRQVDQITGHLKTL